MRAKMRCFISSAALLVKVAAKMLDAGTLHSTIRCATRCVITRVFPLPAPAIISKGPLTVVTASRCCGFRDETRADVTCLNDLLQSKASLWCSDLHNSYYTITKETINIHARNLNLWKELQAIRTVKHDFEALKQLLTERNGKKVSAQSRISF